jgi:nucleoid-associated protein YgaU
MNLSNLYKPAKLTIAAYQDAARRTPLAGLYAKKIEVQYNPETLSHRHEVHYQPRHGIALDGQARFLYSQPKTLSVKLIFDGTQADNWGARRLGALAARRRQGLGVPTVGERIEQFLAACYRTNSATHEPAFLRLTWGQGVLGQGGFDCRLESADIKYTLFDRDGAPLRAELDAVFVSDLEPRKDAAIKRFSSPDLTHRRRVASGDTLPLLCRAIYGSPEHYLRVAEINGLDDFRVLEPGSELVFPPFERPAGA